MEKGRKKDTDRNTYYNKFKEKKETKYKKSVRIDKKVWQ